MKEEIVALSLEKKVKGDLPQLLPGVDEWPVLSIQGRAERLLS